ncbi:MAG: hypothetical protein AAF585_04345 [Verrucomicrobiota bacterium]
MKKTTFLLSLILALGGVAQIQAADDNDRKKLGDRLKKLALREHDRDEDGELSERELHLAKKDLDRKRDELMRDFDEDDDGELDKEERAEAKEEKIDDAKDKARFRAGARRVRGIVRRSR